MYYYPRSLLLSVVFISPLLFGSVYLWASTLLEFGVFAAFSIHIWSSRQLRLPVGNKLLHIRFLPILLFLLVVFLQMMPLPTGPFINYFPERAEFWLQPFLLAGRNPVGPFFFSFSPWGTLVEFSRFLSYSMAAYIIAFLVQADFVLGNHLYTVRALAWTISLTGCIGSLVAILQVGLGASAIYGFWIPLHSESFMGPYVNRNHLAGLLEMCLPIQLGLITMQFMEFRKNITPSQSSKSKRPNLTMLFLHLIFLITLCGLFLTLSRTGIFTGISLLLIQTVLIMFVIVKYRNKTLIFLLFILGISTLVGVTFSIDFNALSRRFQNISVELETNLRWIIAKDSWNIFLSFPWLGTGLGSFSVVFSLYKTSTTQAIIDHAHQDYLEMLSEIGWPGSLAFFSFFIQALTRGACQIWRVLRNVISAKSEELQQFPLTLGAATGVLALLMHGLVDFNIRIPANALYLFVLAGILLGLPGTQQND